LTHELQTQLVTAPIVKKLRELDSQKKEIFEELGTKRTEEINELKKEIKITTDTLDTTFNKYFGSIFRSGVHLSFFSMQVGRYADLYASSVVSLLGYSENHVFLPPFASMPHESDDIVQDE